MPSFGCSIESNGLFFAKPISIVVDLSEPISMEKAIGALVGGSSSRTTRKITRGVRLVVLQQGSCLEI